MIESAFHNSVAPKGRQDSSSSARRNKVVTPSFFSTLGRQPALGRGFAETDAAKGADRVAVLTHALWTTRFGADGGLVGRSIQLDGEAHDVVGVLPADFELPSQDIALLLLFAFTPEQMSDGERGSEFSSMIARLAPGATVAALDAQLATIADRVLDRLPARRAFAERSGFSGYAVPIREQLVGDTRTSLLVLQGSVILVLLIACANVANLLLMRATGRGPELAIRATLGAGQWRLVRQMLTEGMVLALLGGAAGVAVGLFGIRALAVTTPGIAAPTLNLAVLGFTLGVTVTTGLVFGLVPALAVVGRAADSQLKEDSARSTAVRTTGRIRRLLVVTETALALMLLVAAGLLLKSLTRLQDVDPGFSTESVLTASIDLPATQYPDATARAGFWRRATDDLAALPGVTAVGLTSNVPFSGNVGSGSYMIDGYTPGPSEAAPHGRQEVVGGDYFRAMQIPLVSGRVFTDTDTATRPPVVVIDEYLVNRYFVGQDPIGRQIRRGGPDTPAFTIVGVVGTVNSIDLGEPVMKERLYYPVAQQPRAGMTLLVKTALDPAGFAPQIRSTVQSIDPERPVTNMRTMSQWKSLSLDGRRTPATLLALFGGVAVLLSAIGTYGVLAFGVAQRVREFGIRQALGADSRSIISLVLAQGLRTVGLGLVLGVVGALALTRFLQSLLFGVGQYDLGVFAGVTAILLVVALAACYIPARRATTIAPMDACGTPKVSRALERHVSRRFGANGVHR
ncbi:MAG: ABC transporter permease [Acidobacteria bacterium]|nr:ABC transporter permease [Acidobacteriota bacterium]